jgi:hypothetical protein
MKSVDDLRKALKLSRSDYQFLKALYEFCQKCETGTWYKFSDIASLPTNQERIKSKLAVVWDFGGLAKFGRDISFNNDTWEQTDSFKIDSI